MGGGGADVEYSQSPEQREVYRALQPMVQRLGGTYGGVQQPVQTQIGPGLPAGSLQLTPRELNKWMQYGGQTSGGMPVGSVPYEFGLQAIFDYDLGQKLKKAGYAGLGAMPPEQIQPAMAAKKAIAEGTLTPSGTAPTTPTIGAGPTIGGQGLYDIPHPATAVSAVSPLVSPALWNPYMQAEERLMDVLQSRGQLGAPGAGLSGAAAAGLGEFYEQAARNIGLQSYQLGMPIWEQQVQREMMPWQMLPGLLGGTYSTGIAQEGGGLNLGAGLASGGMGYLAAMGAEATAPYAWPIALTMGAGGAMGGK